MEIDNSRTTTYKRLKEFTNAEMQYIENEWHHVCLTVLDLVPSASKRYNNLDFHFTFDNIEKIINRYNVYPPKHHWYWFELERQQLEKKKKLKWIARKKQIEEYSSSSSDEDKCEDEY